MKTRTIGESADELAKTYKELYDKLSQDKVKGIRKNAKKLALNDLYAKKIIARMAIEQVEAYIKEKQGGEE